jgi:hypothetical protein
MKFTRSILGTLQPPIALPERNAVIKRRHLVTSHPRETLIRKKVPGVSGKWPSAMPVLMLITIFFQSDIVKSDYTKEADSFNLGINWFLNPSVMIKTNYVHTDFDHGLVEGG